MVILFSVIVIVLSFLAIFAYGWVTFLPSLGMTTLYHLRRIRWAIAIFCLGTSLLLFWWRPSTGQLIVMLVVVILTPLSGFNHARRFLVSLDSPAHLPADQASLSDGARVLGFVSEYAAYVWPLELLIPHHIINEEVEGQAVTVAW